MSTAGQDFFDSDWFENHTVFMVDAPMEKLRYYVDIREDLIDKWAKQNRSTEKELAKCVTTDFSAKVLTIPMNGENQVHHHFEKVLWLIQSYLRNGWKNSVKAVNHMDNGSWIVHPGTNRCIAAEYLGCKTLPIMLSVHKKQKLYNELKGTAREITNEDDLRKELNSPNPILFRTECNERLFVDNMPFEEERFTDFTYEFLGKDAWPENDRFKKWNSMVFESLPLQVYYTNNVDLDTIKSDILGKNFYKGFNKKEFQLITHLVESEAEVPKDKVAVYLDKPFNRDIFELFFLLDSEHSLTSTDGKIKVFNKGEMINIPDHYFNV